jgi:outer membrane receptor protein involved in Fe transport
MKRLPKLNLNYVVAAMVAGLSIVAPRIGSAQATAAAVENPNAPSAALEQVVITAEKRATVLDKTPETITVLSGSKLAEMGATGLEDVVTLVPNTSFTSAFGASQLYIRGIGNIFTLAGGDPGVALYTDGTYISDQFSTSASLFDLQRVEVLRGPQGALYGRNATGGAMNLISAKPSNTFKGQTSIMFGEYGRQELEGFLSGPLGEGSTTARLSFQAKKRDGYASNTLAGNVYGPVDPAAPDAANSVAPSGLDDLNSRALRLQTATDFGEAGNLRLIASASRESDNGPNLVILPDAVTYTGTFFGVEPTSTARSAVYNAGSNLVDVNTLQAIYERPIGTNTLTLSASSRKSNAVRYQDIDGTPQTLMDSLYKTRSTDLSLDAHIASDESGPWQWLIGATHLRFDQTQDLDIRVVYPGNVPAFILLGGEVQTRSSAIYGDVRYSLTPKLAIGVGLRVNRDEKSATEYMSLPLFGLGGTGTPSAAWTSTPGHIGLEWNLNEETMAYGKVAHGFKSGAINLGALQTETVKPESVTSFEIGAKTSFLNRKGSFSAALFTSNYTDMQLGQVGNLSAILGNASKARITGLEMEMLVRPVPALTLGASVGLMDPIYTDFTNTDTNTRSPAVGPVSVNGHQLANVSRAQASLSAEWKQAIGSYQTSLSADYVWRDKFYFNEFNTEDAVQGAYGMLNLAASIRPMGGKWKLYGQLKNATNTTALTSMVIAAPGLLSMRSGTYTPPRNFGIGVALDF